MTGPFIIAELSASHCGSLDRAISLVEAAAGAGADAVKLQTWSRITVSDAPLESGPWAGRSLRELYAECHTPWEWHAPIFERCRALGMVGFSTAFDPPAVDFLESLGVPMYKVASFEITDIPLLRRISATGKPAIVSTGMATEDEIWLAIECWPERPVTLLRCVSSYPAAPDDFHLATIPDMQNRFGCDVGLSDHSLGSAVAVVATALGATVIEKHLSLDATGPDGGFATPPDAFAAMVRDVRAAAAALGGVRYGPLPAELPQLRLRRSLWVTQDIAAGERLTRENVVSLRPLGGLPPVCLPEVLGKRAVAAIASGTPLLAHHLMQ